MNPAKSSSTRFLSENAHSLLGFMFRPGETVCVSPNKYGYQSIPLENLNQESVTLLSTKFRDGLPAEECVESINTNELKMLALNPIQGWRDDASCYKYRNFLIEMDYGEIDLQKDYFLKRGLPFSALIFSGNKSIHCVVCLEDDLGSEKEYRRVSGWILNVMTMADQNTKNPSRSTRIPDALRENGNTQSLLEIRTRVRNAELFSWLQQFPDCDPNEERRVYREYSDSPSVENLPRWVTSGLIHGFDFTRGRNNTWFSIASAFRDAGFSNEHTIECLEKYFTADPDFTHREWTATIRSAYRSR